MNFALGDTVTWSSSANGVSKTKEGVVMLMVPPRRFPHTVLRETMPRGLQHYDTTVLDGCGNNRPHESYIIAVAQDNGRKPKLYSPRVQLLQKVE